MTTYFLSFICYLCTLGQHILHSEVKNGKIRANIPKKNLLQGLKNFLKRKTMVILLLIPEFALISSII